MPEMIERQTIRWIGKRWSLLLYIVLTLNIRRFPIDCFTFNLESTLKSFQPFSSRFYGKTATHSNKFFNGLKCNSQQNPDLLAEKIGLALVTPTKTRTKKSNAKPNDIHEGVKKTETKNFDDIDKTRVKEGNKKKAKKEQLVGKDEIESFFLRDINDEKEKLIEAKLKLMEEAYLKQVESRETKSNVDLSESQNISEMEKGKIEKRNAVKKSTKQTETSNKKELLSKRKGIESINEKNTKQSNSKNGKRKPFGMLAKGGKPNGTTSMMKNGDGTTSMMKNGNTPRFEEYHIEDSEHTQLFSKTDKGTNLMMESKMESNKIGRKKQSQSRSLLSIGVEKNSKTEARTKLQNLDQLQYKLQTKQILDFERKGHTITYGLFTKKELEPYIKLLKNAYLMDEIKALQQKVRVLTGDKKAFTYTKDQCYNILSTVDPDYIPFLQTFNMWREPRNKELLPLFFSKGLGKIAADLLGVNTVRLYQDSMFVKRPGDGPTLWHSDLHMTPFDTNNFITVWIPLQDIPSFDDGGSALTFASASHRDFAAHFWNDPHQDLGEGRYQECDYDEMKIGDATWHHGWTLHSSPPNDLTTARYAITMSFVDADARILSESTLHRPDDEDENSYLDWINDCVPGEIIPDHPLLPLVYSRI